MNKRVWTGLLVGLLAATALVLVGVGAFHAGQRHSVTVAPVTGAAGETVRVVGYGHWGPWAGPPFGFLFPLLVIGIVVLLIAGLRRASWGGPGGWGGGPCGPGGKEAMLDDWHRQVHAESQTTTGTPSGSPPGAA